MIRLSLSDWFAALLVMNLGAVFAVSLYYSVRRARWTPRQRAAPQIFRCTVCGHVYLDRRNVPMAECTKCGNMNESVKSL